MDLTSMEIVRMAMDRFKSHTIGAKPSSVKVQKLHYIEFQTRMTELLSSVLEKNLSPTNVFLLLTTSPQLFFPIAKNSYQMLVDWLCLEENREVLIKLIRDKNSYSLFFSEGQKLFLVLTLASENLLIVKRQGKNNNKWTDANIKDIVSVFNEILRCKQSLFQNNIIEHLEPLAFKKKKFHLTKSAIVKLTHQYENQNITYKIKHILLDQAQRRRNTFSFFLDWESNTKLYPLKVSLTRGANYHSWFLNEEQLLSHYYPNYKMQSGQMFYTLIVKEPNNHVILSDWFTLDGKLAELHDVKKGHYQFEHAGTLTGRDVLDIHKFFLQLFRPSLIFITDNAVLLDKDSIVPLRLILYLVYGITYYEKNLNAKIIKCSSLDTAYEGEIGQNERVFQLHGNYLRSLKLDDYETMLKEEKQRVLTIKSLKKFQADTALLKALIMSDASLKEIIAEQKITEISLLKNSDIRREIYQRDSKDVLFKNYKEYERFQHGYFALTTLTQARQKYLSKTIEVPTLSLLAAAIWEAAKKEKMDGVMNHLIEFSSMLCKGLEVSDHDIDLKAKDIAVTTRVRTRLWKGGRFWYHTMQSDDKKDLSAEIPRNQKLI